MYRVWPLVLIWLAGPVGTADAGFILWGPTAYKSANDSPFASLSFRWFYREDAEDGSINVPGVTAQSNTPNTTLGVIDPGPATDSVDADDGSIDGYGRDGHSMGEVDNKPTDDLGYTFSFNATVLGSLPTHAGLVWTDGDWDHKTQVEFFGPAGELLGKIGPVKISDSSFRGETAEDRFFGAYNAAGISKITIRSPGGAHTMEVDHLQYGAVVPEPDGWLLDLAGLAAVLWVAKRAGCRRQPSASAQAP